jgi:hypothetical protein
MLMTIEHIEEQTLSQISQVIYYVSTFLRWNFYGFVGPIFHDFLISTLVTDKEYPT